MNNSEEKKFTGVVAAKSVLNFLINFMLQIGILAFLIFLHYRSGYAEYIADNLASLFFTIGCMFLLYWIVYLYFYFENISFLMETKNVWMIFLAMDICLVISFACDLLDVYTRPIALFALLALFLVGYREAIFLNIVYSVVVFLLDVFLNYEAYAGGDTRWFSSFMICFIGGMFAIFFGKHIHTRFGVLGTAVIIAVPSVIIISLLEATDFESFGVADFFRHIGFGALGSVFSVAFFMILLPVFENLFRILTVFRLHELIGPDAKLLKRLKEEAPGTFNHSVVVAGLAESCASAVGENAELARAAAYYHDVGKLRQPEFFTENQGDHNMHDELTPELSADIIRSHTKDGADLLRTYRMPEFFADVAEQHHGTMPITYFYTKALRMSDGEIKIEDYSYEGPKPVSKIAAIIMIADACEASTRSLQDRSAKNVESVVRNIIQQRMDLEQFSECDLSMNELQIIKNTLVGALTGIYHHRIKYPDVRFTRSGVEDNGGTIYDRNGK
jgi:hypothetical protein